MTDEDIKKTLEFFGLNFNAQENFCVTSFEYGEWKNVNKKEVEHRLLLNVNVNNENHIIKARGYDRLTAFCDSVAEYEELTNR